MPSVTELSAPYGNFMLGPRAGPAVCEVCFDLTDGYERCYGCANTQQWLDAVVPISYSIGHEQLHHALACYKRQPPRSRRSIRARAGSGAVAVPGRRTRRASRERPEPRASRSSRRSHRALRRATRFLRSSASSASWSARPVDRYERLLRRSSAPATPRTVSLEKFKTARNLQHQSVLLIDDTWTTGANAQSAAAASRSSGGRDRRGGGDRSTFEPQPRRQRSPAQRPATAV